jgi:hypothetical protein
MTKIIKKILWNSKLIRDCVHNISCKRKPLPLLVFPIMDQNMQLLGLLKIYDLATRYGNLEMI